MVSKFMNQVFSTKTTKTVNRINSREWGHQDKVDDHVTVAGGNDRTLEHVKIDTGRSMV